MRWNLAPAQRQDIINKHKKDESSVSLIEKFPPEKKSFEALAQTTLTLVQKFVQQRSNSLT